MPSYAGTDVVTWNEFDARVIDQELGYAESLGINSVRIFLQYHVYEKDPERFLRNVETFLGLCEKHKIRAMLVPFDSCMGVAPSLESVEYWVASPGPHRTNPDFYAAGEKFIRDLADRFGKDRRVLMWDVMNEPTVTLEAASPEGRKRVWDFVRHFADYLRQCGVSQPLTAGVVGNHNNEVIDHVDVLSIHAYTKDMSEAMRIVEETRELAEDKGKRVIVTECGMPGAGTEYAPILKLLREEQIGFFFWELMIGKDMFRHVQGIVYPDGTVRNKENAEAILGKSLPQLVVKPEGEGVPLDGNCLTWPRLYAMMYDRMSRTATNDDNYPERHSALVGGIVLKFVEDRLEELGNGIREAEKAFNDGDTTKSYKKIDQMIAIAHEGIAHSLNGLDLRFDV